MFKKLIAATMAALTVIVVVGCAAKKPAREFSAQELKDAISASRDEESNQYLPIVTNDDAQDQEMLFELMQLPAKDIKTHALSVSLMNVHAYAVGVLVPAEGKQEAVLKAVNAYVAGMQKSFESYLPNQYEITKQAIVKAQEDGSIILVMCEDSQTVYDNIVKALAKN